MINKGKGKLKWERDMPRDIEEKLEVGNFLSFFFFLGGDLSLSFFEVVIFFFLHLWSQ